MHRVSSTLSKVIAALACWTALAAPVADSAQADPSHAIAMHVAPALPPDFRQMPHANPDAPKGGRMVQGVLGTFDSLNPFIVRATAAAADAAAM